MPLVYSEWLKSVTIKSKKKSHFKLNFVWIPQKLRSMMVIFFRFILCEMTKQAEKLGIIVKKTCCIFALYTLAMQKTTLWLRQYIGIFVLLMERWELNNKKKKWKNEIFKNRSRKCVFSIWTMKIKNNIAVIVKVSRRCFIETGRKPVKPIPGNNWHWLGVNIIYTYKHKQFRENETEKSEWEWINAINWTYSFHILATFWGYHWSRLTISWYISGTWTMPML